MGFYTLSIQSLYTLSIFALQFLEKWHIRSMNLKEYLQTHKIKKEEFATSMGVSYGSILKWTYGGRFPRPQHLQKIHEFTEGKVTADDFLSQIPK